MPSLPIASLPSSPAQSGDLIPVQRGSQNFAVTADSIAGVLGLTGLQTATLTLTAAQLRTLSAGGDSAQIIAPQVGKRICVFAAIATASAGVTFAAGNLGMFSYLDHTGAGSGVFFGVLNQIGSANVYAMGGPGASFPIGSAIDTISEGVFIAPDANYVTPGATVSVTVTIFYQVM